MIIFLSLAIPFLTAAVLYLFFRHKTVWWELSIPLVASFIFILIFKFVASNLVSLDTEYLNDAISEARYYEPWDEYIHRTCTETYACGMDSKGRTRYCTRTYDCSYIDYHPAHWEIMTSTGWKMKISESEYKRLVKKFNKTPKFINLHRDYHHRDGDMYRVKWDGSDDKLECVVTTNSYENKTQVSKGIYNYPDVTEKEVKKYNLYDYPTIKGNYKQDHLLGSNNKMVEHKLDVINARLGPKRELKTFILLFDENQSIEAGYKQRDYWEGGNKNEFVVCIGVSKSGKPNWCLPFTWSDNSINEIEIRSFVMNQEKLDLVKITDKMYSSLKNFERKKFSDFNYLQVYPTTSQIIWCFVLTFLLNISLSIWIIKNNFHSDNNKSFSKNNRYNRKRFKYF